jgi:hypothetical protein
MHLPQIQSPMLHSQANKTVKKKKTRKKIHTDLPNAPPGTTLAPGNTLKATGNLYIFLSQYNLGYKIK